MSSSCLKSDLRATSPEVIRHLVPCLFGCLLRRQLEWTMSRAPVGHKYTTRNLSRAIGQSPNAVHLECILRPFHDYCGGQQKSDFVQFWPLLNRVSVHWYTLHFPLAHVSESCRCCSLVFGRIMLIALTFRRNTGA